MTVDITTCALEESILTSLSSAKSCKVPFQHWDVEGFLTEDVRNKMLDIVMPAAVNFKYDGTRAGDAQHMTENTTPPKRMFINPAHCDKYPEFADLKDALLSEDVLSVLQNKYKLNTDGLYLRIEYINDYDGFYLRPHTDIAEKKFTLFVYLNKGPEYIGTDFYDSDHNVVKTARFGPNLGYIFIPSHNTWHGLEANSFKGRRASLLINYVTFKTDFPVPSI